MAKPTTVERFWSKVHKTEGCWLFQGGPRRDGYRGFGIGSLTDGTRTNVLAHRFAYQLVNGPIPAGTTIDHECHNRDKSCSGGTTCRHRRCIRPDHLAAKPIRDNLLGGRTLVAQNIAKTHCPKGHPYDEVNTRWVKIPSGRMGRSCRTCHTENRRRRGGKGS